MPSNKRISQHYQDKKNKVGRNLKFVPDLKEWTEACRVFCYDSQIAKHFDIHKETFYKFIDRQRYEKEQGRPSEFLDAYIEQRSVTKRKVLNKLIDSNDTAAIIFSAKSYGGLKEAKDAEMIALKRKELLLKNKEFIAKIAERYDLDFEDLKAFADRYFENVKGLDVGEL